MISRAIWKTCTREFFKDLIQHLSFGFVQFWWTLKNSLVYVFFSKLDSKPWYYLYKYKDGNAGSSIQILHVKVTSFILFNHLMILTLAASGFWLHILHIMPPYMLSITSQAAILVWSITIWQLLSDTNTLISNLGVSGGEHGLITTTIASACIYTCIIIHPMLDRQLSRLKK
jgi:hypothetical protein